MAKYFNSKYLIFLVLSVVYTMVCFISISPITLGETLMQDIGINAGHLGVISSICFLSYAIVQPISGFLSDKIGAKNVLIICLIGTVFSSYLFSQVDSYVSAVVARALLGLTIGGILIPSLKLLNSIYNVDEVIKMTGLFLGLCGTIGTFVATISLPLFNSFIGWRTVFIVCSLMTIILIIPVALMVKKEAIENVPSSDLSSKIDFLSIGKNLGSREMIILSLMFFIVFGVYVSFQGLWAIGYLSHTSLISKDLAGFVLLALPIGYFIGSITAGYFSERFFYSHNVTLKFLVTTLFVAWVILTMFPKFIPFQSIGLLLGVIGATTGMVAPLVLSILNSFIPHSLAGLFLGLINAASYLGIFIFQILTGYLLDQFSINHVYTSHAFFMMMLFCTVMLLLMAGLSFLLAGNFVIKPFIVPKIILGGFPLRVLPIFARVHLSKYRYSRVRFGRRG